MARFLHYSEFMHRSDTIHNQFMRSYLHKCDNLVTTHLLRQARIGCMGWGMTDRFIRSPRTALRPQPNLSAFTLIEMLAVVAIIAIMLTLIAPAVGNFGSTAGRKGAVNILMNTMEQARVAALESGREVHIVFWRRQFPERDAIMVVRDPDPDSGTTTYEFLTRWIKMPKGVLLHDNQASNILKEDIAGFRLGELPGNVNASEIGVLTFNGFGVVQSPPPSGERLMLFIADGVRGTDGSEAVFRKETGIFEIISLRRFTGRASLEVSAI
jgi:prepilin-type N-terminal cleavage/methylation domain-containing protein